MENNLESWVGWLRRRITEIDERGAAKFWVRQALTGYAEDQVKKCNITNVNGGILEDFPENMPLYKDSGLWQLRSDDMEDVILDQGVNESDVDFINRCKAYYR